MLKDTTYKEKFAMLKSWLPVILESIKKDLKNEHLKSDGSFCRQYLPGKNMHKITTEDLVNAYSLALAEGENAEQLGEYISNRWLMKNSELYGYFEERLSSINPDFSAIQEIDLPTANDIVNGAVESFGASRTYLFSVLNSVVFPKDVYDSLGLRALEESERQAEAEAAENERQSLETMRFNYEQQISRLEDKYEKKLKGMQKMYQIDVAALKKQISGLQKKLNQQ